MKTFTICLKNGIIFKINAKIYYKDDLNTVLRNDEDELVASFKTDEVSAIIDNKFIESYIKK